MKRTLIWLDDLRDPNSQFIKSKFANLYKDFDEIVWIKNYRTFVSYIYQYFEEINCISFDHDLGDFIGSEEFTGYDCAKALIDYCIDNSKDLPTCYVHSSNLVGANNIKKLIDNFKDFHKV